MKVMQSTLGYVTHPLQKIRLENLWYILLYGEKVPLLLYCQKVKTVNCLSSKTKKEVCDNIFKGKHLFKLPRSILEKKAGSDISKRALYF